uniref:Uncharacterized protein n=1 Tax=Romanomermis culicivorax TaxID=13658 RepID=A0A915JH86_ROMCU
MLLKVVASIKARSFLPTSCNNILEEIPPEEQATNASIPDLIVQPAKEADSNNEFPVETSITNMTVSASHDENFLPGYPFIHYPGNIIIVTYNQHILAQLSMIDCDLYATWLAKEFGAKTGAKVTGTKITGAQTASSEMTKCQTRYRQNGGAEMCLSVLCMAFTIVGLKGNRCAMMTIENQHCMLGSIDILGDRIGKRFSNDVFLRFKENPSSARSMIHSRRTGDNSFKTNKRRMQRAVAYESNTTGRRTNITADLTRPFRAEILGKQENPSNDESCYLALLH